MLTPTEAIITPITEEVEPLSSTGSSDKDTLLPSLQQESEDGLTAAELSNGGPPSAEVWYDDLSSVSPPGILGCGPPSIECVWFK